MNLIGRAELIHALAEGGEDLLAATAKCLGFEEVPQKEFTPKPETPLTIEPQFSWELQTEERSKPEKNLNVPFWRVVACGYNEAVLSEDGQEEAPVSFDGWQNRPQKPPAFIPLAKWPRLFPYLRQAAMGRAPGSQLDLPRIVHRFGQGELLQRLPRKRRPAWGAQVQVVLDRSDRLIPYWDDQEWLAGRLARLLPTAAYQVAGFCEGLTEPLFADHQPYQAPAPGGLVLVLGDLGQLAEDPATRQTWRQFGERLVRGGCRAVALFPCGQCAEGQNPPWKVLSWERTQSPVSLAGKKQEVEALLALLAPAVRVEPGLLRGIRRWQNLDAAVESLFWQHPGLSGTSSVAATFDPAWARKYRAEFDRLPESVRLEVLRRIREWRYALPEEIWFEECALNPGIHRLLTEKPQAEENEEIQALRRDVLQAEKFFQRLGQDFLDGGAGPGARHWYRRVERRIPEPGDHADNLRPALNRLWHGVHRGESNAQCPAGYDPAHIPSRAALRSLQVFQHGEQLRLREAPHPAAADAERGASWLGQLQTRNARISLEQEPPQGGAVLLHWKADIAEDLPWPSGSNFILRGDAGYLAISALNRPAWAETLGRDAYGLWAEFVLENITQRLRWIPPGRFMMGSPVSEKGRFDDEGPPHPVTLTQGFWLFDTAVTQALWQAVMGENPSHFEGRDRPVENVSWNDCQAFLDEINKRLPGLHLVLPSEAQWEYACRAGSSTPFHFGEDITQKQVNYEGEQTVAVKDRPCNAWGLYQMHGNVWEWCQDYLGHYPADAQEDPVGPTDGTLRSFRGGSWSDFARGARAASRDHGKPDYRDQGLGFRCARLSESGFTE